MSIKLDHGIGTVRFTCLSLIRIGTVLTLTLCWASARAQQRPSPPENPQAADTGQRKKAYELLESIADQIGTLQSPENRARLASNIAALLWSHDEKRARTLLVSVENDIRAGLASVTDADFKDVQTRMVFLQLRADTAERIARYDADLALAFFNATAPTSDRPNHEIAVEAERRLQLRLANQVAAENSGLALKLARQSLARGFSHELISLLVRIHKKDKAQALVLYKEIVARFRDSKEARNPEYLYLATNLVRSFKPPQADESTFQELIGVLINVVLENGCGNKLDEEDSRAHYCSQIGLLLPQMEKVDPIRAARLKQWAPDQQEVDWSAFYAEAEGLGEEGTVDDILKLLSKYPQLSNQIYWQAVRKAQESGDLERARKIANEVEPGYQQAMLAEIDRHEKSIALNEKKLADVQQALLTLPRVEERVQLLFMAANRIGASDRKASLKLLDQAAGMIETMKPGSQQTESQLALALMYSMDNSDRGLAIMESLLPKLNELVAGAVKLDGYETHNVRDGEWNMSAQGIVGNLLSDLAQHAGFFAWCDFDRAVSLAGQFERSELRMMAQLKLAQSILAGKPKRALIPVPQRNRFYG